MRLRPHVVALLAGTAALGAGCQVSSAPSPTATVAARPASRGHVAPLVLPALPETDPSGVPANGTGATSSDPESILLDSLVHGRHEVAPNCGRG